MDKETAFSKLQYYCAYQERCESEVLDKLHSLEVDINDFFEIIISLREENYLNEQRFACTFAGSKFRLKKWGRNKIRLHLKRKKVKQEFIEIAFEKEIDEEDYMEMLRNLAEKKAKSLRSEKNIFRKRQKISNFLLQRGFENYLIREVLP
ncbi:MAG: regulatory protein RecX [Chitinophagales bacterium]